jgi:hypothetical protein
MKYPRVGEYFPAKAEKWEIRIIVVAVVVVVVVVVVVIIITKDRWNGRNWSLVKNPEYKDNVRSYVTETGYERANLTRKAKHREQQCVLVNAAVKLFQENGSISG